MKANRGVDSKPKYSPGKPVRTPTFIQMEALECGAAALGSILAYYGRYETLETLREQCGVSRDGSKASAMVKAARNFGLTAAGYRKEPEELETMVMPVIVHWNFNHFVVLEGFRKGFVCLNDPACGPRSVSREEFDQCYTGIVLVFEPGPDFKPGGIRPNVWASLRERLKGSEIGLIMTVILGLFLMLTGLISPVITQVFVDDVLLGQMSTWAVPLLAGLAITALVRGIIASIQQNYLLDLENKIASTSAARFFWHLLRLPVDFFIQRFPGEVTTRVGLNDAVARLLTRQLATNSLDAVMAVFYFSVMMYYDPALAGISLLIAGCNGIFLRFMSRRRTDLIKSFMQEQGKMQSTAVAGIMNIESLKATGIESDFFTRWAGYQAKAINSEQELRLTSQMYSAIPPLLTALNTAVILALGGMHVLSGTLTIGGLVAVQGLMASMLTPVNNLVQLGGMVQETEASIERLEDVLRNKVDPVLKVPQDDNMPARLKGYLEIKNCTFGYNRLEPPLLNDFNLSLKPGDRVALVGKSGSGKSTIARLVTGLYQPWAGDILFDGRLRSEIPRHVLTSSVAMVDQEAVVFEGSIQENLTLWDEHVASETVIQAAKDACIHDEIVVRPGDYTNLVEESGRNFSGGQIQRMEIARALVHNPSILILDEASSALDPEMEQQIDENLRRRGTTCLIIAHRLSTIRDCNEIIVMDQGRVAERGTHVELVKQNGLYHTLISDE